MSLVPRSVDFEACWRADCQGPLSSLFKDDGKTPATSASALYYAIYHLCIATPRDHLLDVYHRIGSIFIEQAACLRDRMVNEAQSGRASLLCSYARNWRTYNTAVQRIDSVCMYLNKVIEKLRDEHLPGKTTIVMVDGQRMEVRLKPIGVLGLHIWKKAVLVYTKDQLDNILVKEILQSVHKMRLKENISISLEELEGAIKSFSECDSKEYFGPVSVPFQEEPINEASFSLFYESELEAPLIVNTKDFYSRESSIKIADEDITGYVRYAESRLREEVQNVKTIFPTRSSAKIVSIVEEQLILVHTRRLQNDFSLLLDKEMNSDLEIVYRLLQRIPDGIEPLANCFERYVFEKGKAAIDEIKEHYGSDGGIIQSISRADIKVCGMYVTQLGPLLRSFKKKVADFFNQDARFYVRIDDAFRKVISISPPCTRVDSGGLLAEFFDMLMQDEIAPDRQAYTGDSTQVIFKTFVEDGVQLVNLLEDKETFTSAYVAGLAKRLIYRLSHYGEVEMSLIRELGKTCGYEIQVRMQKMFSDMHLSLQLRSLFTRYLTDNSSSLNLELSVQVPTYVVWPLSYPMDQSDPSTNILPDMQLAVKQYTNFYKTHWPNRKLYWLHHLSRVTLMHAGAKGKVYELVTTIPQANLLIQFQSKDSIMASELMELLGLLWVDFCAVLKPILNVDLLKWKKESSVEPTLQTRLEYVDNWSHGRSRVRLCHYTLNSSIDSGFRVDLVDMESKSAAVSQLQSEESPLELIELSENKKFFLQAAIVKLLKQHKELSPIRLSQLVSEVAAKPGPISFNPLPAHLVSVLEQLSEKQYLEYDQRRDLYVYMP